MENLPTYLLILVVPKGFGDCALTLTETVHSSYDYNQSLNDNFNEILGALCPQSVYCDGENRSPKMVYSYTTDAIRTAREELQSMRGSLPGCCDPCSCRTDCQVTNNCCSDAKPEQVLGIAETSQSCLQADLDQYRHIGSVKENTIFYFMVTKCPNTTSTANMTQKCESPNLEFLDEIIPVQSPVTGLIYRNRFCAECNGVLSFSAWQVHAHIAKRAFDYFGEQLLQDLDKLYSFAISTSSKAAILLFYPPVSELDIARSKRCFYTTRKSISNCERTITLNSSATDQFIMSACSYKRSVFTKAYNPLNNIFCLLCVGYRQVLIKDNTDCGSFEYKGFSDMIGILFGLTEKVGEQKNAVNERLTDLKFNESMASTKTCSCQEWHDRTTDTCRQIHCAMGHIFIACECVKIMKEVSGLPIMIVLRLRSTDPHRDDLQTDQIGLSKAAVPAVHRALSNINKASIETFPYTLFRHIHNGITVYDLLVEITTLQGTDTVDMMQTLFYIIQDGIVIRVNGNRFKMMLAPVGLIQTYEKINFSNKPVQFDQQLFNEYGENMTLLYFYPEIPIATIKPTIIFSKHIFCNRIIISKEELDLFYERSRLFMNDYDINLAVHTEQTSTVICLEDFKSVLRSELTASSSTNVRIARPWFVLLWLILCRLVIHRLQI